MRSQTNYQQWNLAYLHPSEAYVPETKANFQLNEMLILTNGKVERPDVRTDEPRLSPTDDVYAEAERAKGLKIIIPLKVSDMDERKLN